MDGRPNQKNELRFQVWTARNEVLVFGKCCASKVTGCCSVFVMY